MKDETGLHVEPWHFLREMEENLDLNGDAPTEQNHSSVINHLGEGASWEIAEQVSKLL